ncbi:hypothetical protein Avbf_05691 [Armadillidium vulgare]|nr:hypothetical protein Avbf_05691 [Armadillidium vulgare]
MPVRLYLTSLAVKRTIAFTSQFSKDKIYISYFIKMWFEVLPTFGIIVTLMYAPTVSWYILHKLAYDNTLREAVELDDE